MKTVQMTLDDDLVEAVDRTVKRLHTSRSAFARKALRDALMRYSVALLEQKHRKGYLAKPVKKHEFSPWEDEQVWGDELNGVKSAGTSSSIPIRSGPCSY